MNRIQKFFVFALFCALGFSVNAQEEKPQEIDDKSQTEKTVEEKEVLSPPAVYSASMGDTEIKINYGAPSVRGRAIWGELVPYGKIWRTGANAATTIETNTDMLVEGQALTAGSYAIFTIPGEDEWTVIFNSNPKQWGHYDYDESKDVLRVTVAPQESPEFTETMSFDMVEGENGGQLVLKWEKLMIPIGVAPSAN